MGNKPSREEVGFGVELEITALPRRISRESFSSKWGYYQQGYQDLKSAMEAYDIRTLMTTFGIDGRFQKYPPNYESWFLTYDSSVAGRDEKAIPIEVVSRTFMVPEKDWMDHVPAFWNAFYEVFTIETINKFCGTHVHVKPMESEGYDMQRLRKIAYATIIYEKHVLEILPKGRRRHDYCKPNTELSPALKKIFKGGRSKTSYEKARLAISEIYTPSALCTFMQGDQERGRQALWNFKNLNTPGSGTIEFRGLPGVHSAQETIHWILFAVGFLLLAEEEDKFGNGKGWIYLGSDNPKLLQRTEELFRRISKCNQERLTKKWTLPDDYHDMLDEESRSRSLVRTNSKSWATSRSLSSRASSRNSRSAALYN